MPSSTAVPFPVGAALGGSSDTSGKTPGQRLKDALGTDILLTDKVQVVGIDYAEVSGIDNLQRAIWRRLATRPGEYRVRPDYGVGLLDFVKKPMTGSNLSLLRHRIIDNLSRDPRVGRPIGVELTPLYAPQVGLRVALTVVAQGLTLQFVPFIFMRGA